MDRSGTAAYVNTPHTRYSTYPTMDTASGPNFFTQSPVPRSPGRNIMTM